MSLERIRKYTELKKLGYPDFQKDGLGERTLVAWFTLARSWTYDELFRA